LDRPPSPRRSSILSRTAVIRSPVEWICFNHLRPAVRDYARVVKAEFLSFDNGTPLVDGYFEGLVSGRNP